MTKQPNSQENFVVEVKENKNEIVRNQRSNYTSSCTRTIIKITLSQLQSGDVSEDVNSAVISFLITLILNQLAKLILDEWKSNRG